MRRSLLYFSLLFALTFLTIILFWQVGEYGFSFIDDELYVTANVNIQGGLGAEGVWWALTDFKQASNWHPLTWISHMLDVELFGLDAGKHHVMNLLIHSANGALLFMLLSGMTGAVWRSFVVAVFFAVHPLHVESVVWISERKDVLSTFLWMLTIGLYARYANRPTVIKYILCLFLFVLSLMAKPMVVTLPFLLILLDYWPLCRLGEHDMSVEGGGSRTFSRLPLKLLLLEKVPFLALMVPVAAITLAAQSGVAMTLTHLSMSARIANMMLSYQKYIAKTIWPRELSVIYPHPGYNFPFWQVMSALVLLGAVSTIAVWKRRQYPYLLTGWLWFLGTLVPVIGLVQVGVQAMADRYMYVPIIGLFIMAVWGVSDFAGRRLRRPVVLILGTATLIGLLSVTAWARISIWRDDATLFASALEVTSGNWMAHVGLGKVLEKRGKADQAEIHFRKALKVVPDYVDAHMKLGVILSRREEFGKARAHFLRVLRISPENALAHDNLGNIHFIQGEYEDAVRYYQKAISLDKNYAIPHYNLALTLTAVGRKQEALSHYREAVRIYPDYNKARLNLAVALADAGEIEEAITHYSKILEINPLETEAHYNMGIDLISLGRIGEAEIHLREALRLQPDHRKARFHLQKILRSGHSPSRRP